MPLRTGVENAVVEPIGGHHVRDGFHSGQDPLDHYLKHQSTQDVRRKVAASFVAVDTGSRVVGYYTLSSFSIRLPELPTERARRLPRYPRIPATLLGRLAVDKSRQGTGLGEHLLMDALARSLRATSDIASYAVVVDAIDERAIAFYRRYDFTPFPDQRNRLFLPMTTIAKAFS